MSQITLHRLNEQRRRNRFRHYVAINDALLRNRCDTTEPLTDADIATAERAVNGLFYVAVAALVVTLLLVLV